MDPCSINLDKNPHIIIQNTQFNWRMVYVKNA